MITANYKHKFSSNLTWYTAVAATINGPNAHYDLGAGGRGVTTDCHSASAPRAAWSGNRIAPGPRSRRCLDRHPVEVLI